MQPVSGRLEAALPRALDRVNWAAVLWGGWFALVYRLWPWFFGLTFLDISSRVAFTYFNRGPMADSWGLRLGIALLSDVILWGAAAIFGIRANKLAWTRGTLRSPQQLLRQRPWAFLGAALLAVGQLYGAYYALGRWSGGLAVSLAAAVFEWAVLLGLWQYDRAKTATGTAPG